LTTFAVEIPNAILFVQNLPAGTTQDMLTVSKLACVLAPAKASLAVV
jgi:hypothetical protein